MTIDPIHLKGVILHYIPLFLCVYSILKVERSLEQHNGDYIITWLCVSFLSYYSYIAIGWG